MPLRPGIGGIKRTPTKLIQGVNGVKTEVTEYWSSDGGVKKLIYQAIKGTPISQFGVGSIVKLNETGIPAEYIIVHQGKPSDIYDNSCSGSWILRKDIITESQWDSSRLNSYEDSDVDSWLNSVMYNKYDSGVKSSILQVRIPYRKGGGLGIDQTGYNGLSRKIFTPSITELGITKTDNPNIPNDGSKLDYFGHGTSQSANEKRVSYFGSSPHGWYTRSPFTNNESSAWFIKENGDATVVTVSERMGVRPLIVLNFNSIVTAEGIVVR